MNDIRVAGPTISRSRPGPCLLFAFALAGLVLGHALSYLIAVPEPFHRDLVLQRSGHGYLPTLIEVTLVLLLAGTASLVGRALRRGPGGEPGLATLVTHLAALQVAAFGGQEVLERLFARVPLSHLGRDDVLLIGLVTQVGVAFVGAVLLRWLVRASNRVPELARAHLVVPPRPAPILMIAAPAGVAISIRPRLAFAMRAPPSSLSSPA